MVDTQHPALSNPIHTDAMEGEPYCMQILKNQAGSQSNKGRMETLINLPCCVALRLKKGGSLPKQFDEILFKFDIIKLKTKISS